VTQARAYTIAREVLGVYTWNAVIEWALWEHTGYPSFFQGDPETVLREQLRAFRDNTRPRPR
jgi:hypothetical protein